MKIHVQDGDYQAALAKFAPLKWEPIKLEARRIAAERMAEATFAEIGNLIPQLAEREGDEFKRLSDALESLWRRHDVLARLAWPGVHRS